MKRLLTTLFAFTALVGVASAQWVWAPLNTGQGSDETYVPSARDKGFYANGINPKCDISDAVESVDGNGSFKVDYKVEAYDGWGGYVVRVHTLDLATDPTTHYDLSNGKYFSMWVKVTGQPEKTQAGDVNFEFKLKEKKSSDTGEDRWLHAFGTVLDAPPGEWQQLIVPLDQANWPAQATDENGNWEPWNIYGWELAVVYITAGGSTNSPTATGSFLMDKLQILGQNFEPLMSFDSQSDTTSSRDRKDATWLLNDMSWDGAAGARKMILTDESVDTVQGTGAMNVEYAVVGSQDWGGYAELEHVFDEPVSLSASSDAINDKLIFYIKNLVPNTLTGRFLLRVELWDDKDGALELWDAVAPVNFDVASDWQLVQMPFQTAKKPWYELRTGDMGWAQRDAANDGVLDITRIKKLRLGFIVLRDGSAPFGSDIVASGKFIIDLMSGSGYQINDKQAPNAPEGVLGLATETGKNFVIWEDVPGEVGEKYSVFYSTNPITNVTAPGVFGLASGVAEGTQSVEHVFHNALKDASFKFYYAVICMDKAGNIDSTKIGTSLAPTENDSKGIAVVSNIAPAGFVADGNFADWAGIQGFEMKSSNGSATIITQLGPNGGDDDASAVGYAAIADGFLYFGMDVTDDIFVQDSALASYNQDAADLFIGLYEYKGKDHTGYRRGATPDYHFRFNSHRVSDDLDGATVTRSTSPNYKFITTAKGYAFEWKISLADIAALHAGDAVFSPTEGMQIALDLILNDGDATGARESGLRWSPVPLDNGWNNVQSWSYSWIGNPASKFMYVDVKDNSVKPVEFALQQNYPNPFNPSTTVRFAMKNSGNVSLKVYNLLGSEVATLFNGFKGQGEHSVEFNGAGLASGVYFVRMEASEFSSVKKMMLVK